MIQQYQERTRLGEQMQPPDGYKREKRGVEQNKKLLRDLESGSDSSKSEENEGLGEGARSPNFPSVDQILESWLLKKDEIEHQLDELTNLILTDEAFTEEFDKLERNLK